MSKTVIGIVVAVVLAAGALGFVLTRSDDETNSSQTRQTSSSQDAKTVSTAESKSAPISEFLSANQNKKCTYSDERGTGTMYFSSGRLRNDISQIKDGATTAAHMIITEAAQYMWFDSQQNGLKFAFSKTEPNANATKQGGLDATQSYDFRCVSWDVDESFFTPPATVTFTDLTQLQVPGM